MCVVSFVGDEFSKRIQNDEYWKKLFPSPNIQPLPFKPNPYQANIDLRLITRDEFDMLKREVEQLKELLKGAIEYDKRNNEPHCEIEDKVAMLKKIAEAFGVDLTEIFGKKST